MVIKKRKSNGGLIGIDIGSTSIKKLELSRNGDRLRVDDYAVYPLPDGVVVDKSVEKIEVVVAALERIMKTSKSNSTGVAFAIPSSNVFVHIERMDGQLTDQEVQANVNAKLDKIIPFPVAEVAMDFTITDIVHNLKPLREVMIVAAKNDAIKAKQELFELSGIKSNVATTESFAVEKVIPLISRGSDKGFILFDFGFTNTIIYAIKNNKIVYARDHDFGGVQLANRIRDFYNVDLDEVDAIRDEKIMDHDEPFKDMILNPFLEEAATQFNQALQLCLSSSDMGEIDRILLSGGNAGLMGLTDSLSEELGYSVTIAAPFGDMDFAPNVDKGQFLKDSSALLTVCGLALCDVGDSVNLLPWREELELQKKRSYLTGLTAAGIIGLAIAIGGWAALKNGLANEQEATILVQNEMQIVDSKLAELQEVTQLRDEMLERMKLIQGLQSQRPIMVEVANSIVKSIPAQAMLTNVAKDGSVFTFTGKAKDMEVVSQYMRSMKDTGWFGDVFMSNYDSYSPDKSLVANTDDSKVNPKEEDSYGTFIITATLSDYTELKDVVNQKNPVAAPVVQAPADNSGVEVAEAAPAQVEVAEPMPSAPPLPTSEQAIPMQDSNNGGV